MSRAIDVMPVTAGKTVQKAQTATNTQSAGKTTSTRAIDVMPVTVGKTAPVASATGAGNATAAAKQTNTQAPAIIQSANERVETLKSAGAATETGGQSDGLIDAIISVAKRAKNTATGAVKTTAASYANAGGMAAEGAGKWNTRISNYSSKDTLQSAQEAVSRYQAMLDSGKWADGTALTASDRKRVQTMLEANQRKLTAQESYTNAVEASDKAVADKAYQAADQLSTSGGQDIAAAKEGLGRVGQFAVDLGVQGVQMAGDVAASAVVPGSGLALMGVRSGASSAQEARQSGASYSQQLAYGLGSGALSIATEKISSVAAPFKKAFGGGVLDEAISKAASKMTGSAAGKTVLSMLSEGGEEVVEDLVQPILQRMTYDKDALGQYGDSDYWAQTLYDGLVGAAMGGIGSGVEAIQNRRTARNASGSAAGTQTAEAESNIPTQPQNAAEATQNAASGVETAGSKYDVFQAAAIRKDSKTFRNLVAGFDTSVSEFFGKWRNGRSNTTTEKLEKLYLGKMSESAKSKVSAILGYDIDTRDMIVTNDDVKHIIDSHGSAEAELQRGNLPLEQWAIDALPDVVTQPDSIMPGEVQSSGKHPGKQGVLFSKTMPNGTVVTVQFDNKGRKTMELTTMYVKKSGPHTQAFNVENNSSQLTAKPVPDSVVSAQSEGTNPLNVDSTIAQDAENVKTQGQQDILQEILFGGKRADLNTLTEAQQNAVYAANEAGTVGMDATGNVFHVKPENHIDQRTAETVGSRDVNAFQFDHPELHSYFKQAAEALIADADISLQQPMSRRYERTAQGNTVQQAAQTSAHLRQAMDETGLSRAELIDAAQRIVTDHGQENVAAAKRVELILDDMLTHGYTTMSGETVSANEGYIRAKGNIAGAVQMEEAGHGLDDIDRYDGLGNADAGTVNTAFDTMQAQSDEFHPVNPNSAQRIQNEQRRAASEVPTTNPETGDPISKTVSTILNSPLTSPELAPVYENAIAGGQFDYEAVTDRSSVQRAQEKVSRDGYQSVANTFTAKVDMGQTVTKYDMAEAVSAYNRAVSEGDHKTAFELATAMAQAAHTSAQVVQAMNLMNRMTPEGRLLSLRRVVDRMNEQQSRDRRGRAEREQSRTAPTQEQIDAARTDYINMAQSFTLSDELATAYLMAETDEARAAAWDAITTNLANQIPSTFREKADFWRYTSMLTNPTTHIRNIMGNAIQVGVRKLKNLVGAGIERAVLKDESQRTKAVLTRADSDLKQFARSQYETDQSAAMGERKYSDATMSGIHREIMDKRKMFRGDNIVSKAVQGIGDFNNTWLDREDVWFNRPAYVESFAQALKAKGVTAAEAAAGVRQADVDAARAYAISEAQKATYRNTTALSDALSRMGRYQGDNRVLRAGSFAADAFLPFRKTPANILTTGLDYSPLGLGKALYEGTVEMRRGNCEAADVIDSVAAGLTGTGILALGAYLAAEGLLHVRAGDDDKEEAFETATGGQDYALQIGDKSYSLDWAVPAAMPLFAGAAIMKSALEGGNTFDAVCDALLGTSEVVLETSMLSSLNDLISYWSYADSKPLYLIDKAVSSYAGQYIPTVGSKVASALDDTVRKSYVEKGSGQIASDLGYFLQGAAKKVPGVRDQLQPSVDLWGEEVSNGSTAERVFQSFLSPGYLRTKDTNAATEEVRRLAEATGDSSVYPTAVEKSFKVNGETKYLTAEEYTQYAKAVGQTRKQIIDGLIQSKGYQALNDEDKAAAVSCAYEYATAKGKMAVSDYAPSSGFVKGAMESVLPADTYILYKLSADRDKNGSVTSAESARTLQELTGISDYERGKEWEKRNSSTAAAKNPFTGALPQAGISVDTSIRILEKYRDISNAEGVKPKDKGKQFRVYVEGLGLTPAQKQAVKETYSMYGSYYVDW